jgi:hypothetical protein
MRRSRARTWDECIEFIKPVKNTELAQAYWLTDISTPEIIEAYGVPSASLGLTKVAGEALLIGFECHHCSGSITVKSRTNARDTINSFDARLCRLGMDWSSKPTCEKCRDEKRRHGYAAHKAEIDSAKDRIAALRALPYGEYLKTPEWAETRKGALKRARYHCQVCASSGPLHVHHRTYIRRGAEFPSDLIALCPECHRIFHETKKLADNGRAVLEPAQ